MRQTIIATVLLLLASSCSTYKKYSRPEEIGTTGLFGDSISYTDTATIASVPWRSFFRDPDLQSLIDTGLTNNSDLEIASLRVAQAEASLYAARLAYLPAVSFNPQGSVGRYDDTKLPSTYSIGLSSDWEIDIAGRVTNEKRGALATLMQQNSYRQAVSTQLIATIANTYFNLLAQDEQLSISTESLGAWDEIICTLEVCKRVGESNEASVAQARANRLEVENSILSLSQQVTEMENSMCTLLGWTPRSIPRGELKDQVFPDSLAVGVPLQMLENRPDIREAEYALQSAFYSTNIARAAFYPSLTLSGTLGWTNNSGVAVVNPGNWLLNAIGSLVQPVFNNGRNVANLRIAEAAQQEASVRFRQKLLDADAEVNNALTRWQTADRRLEVSRRQIEALENAVRSTRLLMDHSDGGSYLEVLTAQQSLLAAQLTGCQEASDKIRAVIQLYLRWEADAERIPMEIPCCIGVI